MMTTAGKVDGIPKSETIGDGLGINIQYAYVLGDQLFNVIHLTGA
jgi:hypothetical protein